MNEIRIVDGDVDLQQLVRELVRPSGDVLSMYVDIDPRTFAAPASRHSSILAAIDTAERAAPDGRWTGTLDRLRATFENGDPVGASGARGLLVFAGVDGHATMVRLPCPVEQEVAFDSGVHVRQLVRALPRSSWCVLLCNRRTTRVLLGDRDHLEMVDELQDDVDGQHDQGGWSQTRFARNIAGQVDDHLRRSIALVEDLRRTGAFDCLLVGAPAALHSAFESLMPDPLRRTMRGWVDLDIERASVVDVSAAAADAIRTWDDEQLERTLARMQRNAGKGERAVLGIDDVLQALGEQRVDTLVVTDRFGHPGLACPHGDWLAIDGGVCPTHEVRLQPCADVVELAIEHAIRQRAHVSIVDREGPAMQAMRSLGGISAIVRFDVRAPA